MAVTMLRMDYEQESPIVKICAVSLLDVSFASS